MVIVIMTLIPGFKKKTISTESFWSLKYKRLYFSSLSCGKPLHLFWGLPKKMFVLRVHLSGKWRFVFIYQINEVDGKLIQVYPDNILILFQPWSGPETTLPFRASGFWVSRFAVENHGKDMKCSSGLGKVDKEQRETYWTETVNCFFEIKPVTDCEPYSHSQFYDLKLWAVKK